MRRLFLAALIAITCSVGIAAITWTGKAVAIQDGDTIEVLQGNKPHRIRLYGIDCPEHHKDFGKKAKQFTSDMVFGKVVNVEPLDIDRYGRTVAEITINGKSLNKELVKNGLAWWYRKYSPSNKELEELENHAREARKNLWSLSDPVPPWEFRRTGSGTTVSDNKYQTAQVGYHGNVKSKILHRPGCQYYNCKNCVANFKSPEEAIRAGYRPCRICNPRDLRRITGCLIHQYSNPSLYAAGVDKSCHAVK